MGLSGRPEESEPRPRSVSTNGSHRVSPSSLAGARLHTAIFDLIFNTLSDGAKHDVDEIVLKASLLPLNEKQVEYALGFLQSYSFLDRSKITGEVQLSRPVLTFLRRLKEQGDP